MTPAFDEKRLFFGDTLIQIRFYLVQVTDVLNRGRYAVTFFPHRETTDFGSFTVVQYAVL